jgi:OOP family OmpA-OmpF porin
VIYDHREEAHGASIKNTGGRKMKRTVVVLVMALGLMWSGFVVKDILAFEVFLKKERVNVGGVQVELVRTASNFIVLFDSSSSMGERYGNTNMTKIEITKQILAERNKELPDLGYNAGLYSYTPKFKLGIRKALVPYYPMKRYNKEAFAKAIESLPTKAGGSTLLQPALRELDPILSGLSGRTAIFIITDGTYSKNLGASPLELAKELARKYNVCFHVISTAKSQVEKQMVKNVASINACSRVIPFDDIRGRAEYLTGALWVVEEKYVDAFETRAKIAAVKLNNILFDFDSSDIRPQFHGELDRLGRFLQGNSEAFVVLAGFTDSTGAEEYNLALSRQRAESAADYLMRNFNIGADRIVTQWYGEAAPVASNATAEGRSMNRRVAPIVAGLD